MIDLRAFGTVWDFYNWIFGTNHMAEPPNTYGTFVALGFIVAFYIAILELKRREKEGFMKPQMQKMKVGGMKWGETLLYTVIGFILGMKIGGRIFSTAEYQAMGPNNYILSSEGNYLIGFLFAVVFFLYNYLDHKKNYTGPEIEKDVLVRPYEHMGNILLLALLGGILGSKLWDLVGNLNSAKMFLKNPLQSLQSGLSIWGGLWGAALLIYFYAKKHSINISFLLDSLAPAYFLAYAVGRMGCQMSGDGCWGVISDGFTKPAFIPQFLWGQNYAHNVNNDGIPIIGCTENFCSMLPYSVFPTPIYETILVIILFFILWSVRKRFTKYPLLICCIFMIMNGVERFFIEFIRVTEKKMYFGISGTEIITKHQWVALIMIGFALITIPRILKRGPVIPTLETNPSEAN